MATQRADRSRGKSAIAKPAQGAKRRAETASPAPDPASTLPDIDRSAAVARVLRLLDVPGSSGNERAIMDRLLIELRDAGVPEEAISFDSAHQQSPYGGQVGNLIVQLPGTVKAPRRLLMAHVDTVPLCVGCRPVVEGDFIRSADPRTALGGDDRGGAAVVLTALVEILKQKLPHPPLTFFWPVQEEVGLIGARYVALQSLGQPKLCFNWDGGSASTVTIGATGAFDLRVELHGLASHAGVHPEGGISAVAIAAHAIADLHENGWHGLVVKGKNTGTSNIGIIQGGDATNVVTDLVKLRGEVRSHNATFRKKLVDEFRKAFDRAAKKVKNDRGKAGSVSFHSDLKYESFALDEKAPVVTQAQRVIEAIGLSSELRISNGGLDANWLSARGLPTVTLGCGQSSVHTVKEVLSLPDFLHGCRIGLLLACGAVANSSS